MILNILVLVGIILIVVTVVAYNSKRQINCTECDHIHDEHSTDTPNSIISENQVYTQPSGSVEYIKEHI